MKPRLLTLLILLIFFSIFHINDISAQEDKSYKKILDDIKKIDPSKLQGLEMREKAKGQFLHEQKKYDLDISYDSDKKEIMLRKGKRFLSIGTTKVSKDQKIKLIEGQVIVSNENYSIVTQTIDGGVRQVINIYSIDAGNIFEFPLTLPDGYNLTQDGSGNVLIQNSLGDILSFIAKPWAKDAIGNEISTWYTISGTILIQHIGINNESIFPITADPAWCGQSIASTSWIYRGGTHPWSLSITPTTCGKLWILGGGGFNVNYSWQEVLNLTPISSFWDKIYGTSTYWSMYNQYACHPNFAALVGKFPWNIEPTRINVGYLSTVSSGCNP